MGLPMIQVLMIAARQISRPVSNFVLNYGKEHPPFRNNVLIPIGRGLVHMTTRMRMKNLGLGSPTSLAPVSEETALQQAMELVQQLVVFGYSVGVFALYYGYTKYTTPETLRMQSFDEFRMENDERLADIDLRLKRIERALLGEEAAEAIQAGKPLPAIPKRPKAEDENAERLPRPQFKRISALPVDEAARVVLSGGSSVS